MNVSFLVVRIFIPILFVVQDVYLLVPSPIIHHLKKLIMHKSACGDQE